MATFTMDKTSNYLVQISNKEQKTSPTTVVVPGYLLEHFFENHLTGHSDRVILVSAVDTFKCVYPETDPQTLIDNNIIGTNS